MDIEDIIERGIELGMFYDRNEARRRIQTKGLHVIYDGEVHVWSKNVPMSEVVREVVSKIVRYHEDRGNFSNDQIAEICVVAHQIAIDNILIPSLDRMNQIIGD